MSEEPGFLRDCRVAIVGLGLMGGSLALALRGKCAALLGIDPDAETLALADERHVVDRSSAMPEELLPQADLIVLAAPVGAILSLLDILPALHPGSPVVLDLGSTKARVVQMMQALPPRFDAVGGHPMCGKEKASLRHADSQIFIDAPFALTALPRTTRRGRVLAEELVRALGARPLWVEADTHDAWTAATSHLPYLVANALAGATPLESPPLTGPGWRSTTRLADTSAAMMLDVLRTNQGNVLESLARFRNRLDAFEKCLVQGDFAVLQDLLAQGAEHHVQILRQAAPGGD